MFLPTSVATLGAHGFGWLALDDLPSIPKPLGAVGGVGLLLGTAQLLLRLARHRHRVMPGRDRPMTLASSPVAADQRHRPGRVAYAVFGQTVCWRYTWAGVMALFVTLPFGVTGIARAALPSASSRAAPSPTGCSRRIDRLGWKTSRVATAGVQRRRLAARIVAMRRLSGR